MNDPKLKDRINLSNLKMFPHLFRKVLPHLLNNTSISHPMRVRNQVGLKGATRPHWALEVTRGKQGGNSMYSDEFQLGSAQREPEVYIQDTVQTRNKRREGHGKIT